MRFDQLRILFITYGLPAPPNSGARLRDYHLISRVARRHEVHVLSLLEPDQDLSDADSWLRDCKRVDGVRAERGVLANALLALKNLLARRPLATTPYWYPELARKIWDVSRDISFDLVQIEHSYMAPYRESLNPSFTGRSVISLHNIGVFQYGSMMRSSRGRERPMAWLKWWLMRNWEAPAIARFDAAVVVSEQDHENLRAIGCALPTSIVGNGVDTAALVPLETTNQHNLIFVGTMGYYPNREAVRWFAREVLPLIRQEKPDCQLFAVGSGGEIHLADLQEAGVVEVTGSVPRLQDWYAKSAVTVVPLLSGGGTRLKILESMALGVPVVSTAVGCEGLDVRHGRELWMADTPQEFAQGVIELLNNPAARQSMVENARELVVARFDWGLLSRQLMQKYEILVQG